MLRGMMIMEPQRAAMLGQRDPPGADEIWARASVAREFSSTAAPLRAQPSETADAQSG